MSQTDAAVLQGGSADAGFDRTIGNRLQVVVDGDIQVLHRARDQCSADWTSGMERKMGLSSLLAIWSASVPREAIKGLLTRWSR